MADIEKALAIDEGVLDAMERDTIGEILNISMGAAATAISDLLGRRVDITTPFVYTEPSDKLEYKSYEPSVGIEIEYTDGLSGNNYMIMKKSDIQAIVAILLGDFGEELSGSEDGELGEIELSAVGELMNQMMGASSTALAKFFAKSVNISSPAYLEPSEMLKRFEKEAHPSHVVAVRFLLTVEGVLNSEFITLMPVGFSKELIQNALAMSDAQPEPKVTAPAPALAPAPAVAPTPAPASPAAPSAPVSVRPVRMESFDNEEPAPKGEEEKDNFNLILGVPLEVTVEVGRVKLPVKEILDIRPGSVVELDHQSGEPFDVIVNGRLIARGEVVIVDESFGVRITEIVSADGKESRPR